MPVTVDELTTEVIAESAPQLGSDQPSTSESKAPTAIHAELAAIMRLDLRTRAEGFDD
jgi:hypothetical protein